MLSLRHSEPSQFRIRWLGVLLAMVLASSTGSAADGSLGTWRLNLEKSQYSPSPLPMRSLTMVREAVEGGVKVTVTGQLVDGTKTDGTYTAQYDGKEAGVSGTLPCDRISLRQLTDNTFISECRSTGTHYSAFDRIQVSTSGGTMYVVTIGQDAAGRDFKGTLVFDRQ